MVVARIHRRPETEQPTRPLVVKEAVDLTRFALALALIPLLLAIACTVSFMAGGGPPLDDRLSDPLRTDQGGTGAAHACGSLLSPQLKECHHVRYQD